MWGAVLTLPHPDIIRRRLKEMEAIGKLVPVAYRTAHNMAFEKVRSDEVPVKSTGHSNPTKNNATDTEAMARRRQIEEGVSEIDTALALVRSAFGRFTGSLEDQKSLQSAPELDSAIGEAAVRKQRAQQRKRIQNASWNGDSAEVV
jgi:hypothetical protein